MNLAKELATAYSEIGELKQVVRDKQEAIDFLKRRLAEAELDVRRRQEQP